MPHSICAGTVFFKTVGDEAKKIAETVVPTIIAFTANTIKKLANEGVETEKLLRSEVGWWSVESRLGGVKVGG